MADSLNEDKPLGYNEELVTRRKQIQRDPRMPPYHRIGIVMSGDRDLMDLLGDVTRASYKFYMSLKKVRHPINNLAVLPLPETKSEATVRSRCVKELVSKDFIKKVPVKKLKDKNGHLITVSKGTYLLNPKHYIPMQNDGFTEAQDYWEQLD